jgi:hypothetical protein
MGRFDVGIKLGILLSNIKKARIRKAERDFCCLYLN